MPGGVLRRTGQTEGSIDLCRLAGLKPGYNLEFFPYAGVRTTKWEEATDTQDAVGLDAKWGIRPNPYLHVPASPE